MRKRDGSPKISLRDVFGSKRLQERLIARSVRNPLNDCMEWQGCLGRNGYGMLGVGNRRVVQAHRAAYAAFKGEFDESLFVLHRCDNRKCINPEHLFAGTRQDNMKDMVANGRKPPSRPKLSKEQVKTILAQLADGATNKDLANEYGVHQSTVSHIRHGRVWKRHVPPASLSDGRKRQTVNVVRSTCALRRASIDRMQERVS